MPLLSPQNGSIEQDAIKIHFPVLMFLDFALISHFFNSPIPYALEVKR